MNDFCIFSLWLMPVGFICYWLGVITGKKMKLEIMIAVIITTVCLMCFWEGVCVGVMW